MGEQADATLPSTIETDCSRLLTAGEEALSLDQAFQKLLVLEGRVRQLEGTFRQFRMKCSREPSRPIRP